MSKVSFAQRSYEPEIMDDLDASQGEVVYQTLRELATINHLLGGNAVTLRGLKRMLKDWPKDKVVRLADLGCGGGDMLVVIAQWANKKGYRVSLTGVDFNADIVDFAQKNTQAYSEIEYQVADVFSQEFLQQEFDIVLCSLFLHHFTDEELITLLGQLAEQTTLGVLINDLHRHPLAYYSIKWLTQAFSRTPMVKYDVPLSVLRGFRMADWQQILSKASLPHARMAWRWAFRWEIIIPGRRPSSTEA